MEFLLELLMRLLADPTSLYGACQLFDRGVGREIGQVILALAGLRCQTGRGRTVSDETRPPLLSTHRHCWPCASRNGSPCQRRTKKRPKEAGERRPCPQRSGRAYTGASKRSPRLSGTQPEGSATASPSYPCPRGVRNRRGEPRRRSGAPSAAPRRTDRPVPAIPGRGPSRGSRRCDSPASASG